ncbi:tape measure protein [Myroides sp. 1354]|uniref:tape measure protein n=1 Tax=unclassified Myroides TaxID=2642485 RepID=UPI00257705E9|nr:MULTISPECIES: tape measure protein [unclassified Myroides]MDM1045871.1 tape measure protein [Myroides sp. R163-1]MDM1056881.1 tape measure protein [Myroides sp. 1354]MDM1070076.1 tape measure protein [Myroides sp. 1372]
MSNILEYTLTLRDQISAHLKTIGANSDSTLKRFEELERQSKEVAQELTVTGKSAGALKQQLNLLKQARDWIPQSEIGKLKEANKEIRNLEKQISKMESSSSSWFSNAINSIPFANILTNPFVIAGGIAGAALRNGIQQDLQNTSFEVLLGSEDAAKKLVADITKYGAETTYDKIGLGGNAQQMLSFGIDETKIMPTLKAIGDIAMGDTNRMNSLTLAFSQMSSTGKLTGQDLLQMINAGFNPLNEISKKTGKSIGDLKKEMEKGAISAQMVEGAFMSATSQGGQFYGMAEKMGNTLGGKWAQFMDNLTEKSLMVYQYLGPVVEKLIELGGAALDAAFNGIGWLIEKFEEGDPIIWGVALALGAYTTGMILANTWTKIQAGWNLITTGQLWAQVTAWWGLNSAMWANPIGLIIAGVIALAALIGFLIYKIDGWGEAWDNTVNSVKSLWKGFTNNLKLGWLVLENYLMSGIDKIMIAWYKLKSLWNEDAANNALDQINQRSEERKQAMGELAKETIQHYGDALNYREKAVNSLSWNDKGFDDVKNDIKSKLGISDPSTTAPGVEDKEGVDTSLNSGGTSGTSKSNTAIATGGTKHNYITITMDNLVETINVYAQNVKEGAHQAGEMTQDALLRILASAETAAS